jgi:hypothetical protein
MNNKRKMKKKKLLKYRILDFVFKADAVTLNFLMEKFLPSALEGDTVIDFKSEQTFR